MSTDVFIMRFISGLNGFHNAFSEVILIAWLHKSDINGRLKQQQSPNKMAPHADYRRGVTLSRCHPGDCHADLHLPARLLCLRHAGYRLTLSSLTVHRRHPPSEWESLCACALC